MVVGEGCVKLQRLLCDQAAEVKLGLESLVLNDGFQRVIHLSDGPFIVRKGIKIHPAIQPFAQ